MSLLRGLLEQLARAGAPLDTIERKVLEQAGREREELTAAERQRLSKLAWAQENDLAGTAEDGAIARAEAWTMMDVAAPADDRWLTDLGHADDGYLALYQASGRERPSEQIRDTGRLGDLG